MEPERDEQRRRRAAEMIRRADTEPRLIRAARGLRKLLPGDDRYGDPLSVAGDEPAQILGKRVVALSAERPSALREMGLGALQVWQALSEAQGRGRGEEELAILFTDLVDFSAWALDAGDTNAVELLRRVGHVTEPPIERRGGRIVKRLGDGLMAVFAHPSDAVEAAIEGGRALRAVEVAGHRPRLRAGVHVGRPRKLGGDYLGVDVNVAARVAAAARPDEVLVSETALAMLDEEALGLKRRWMFRAKGAPEGLKVYAAAVGE